MGAVGVNLLEKRIKFFRNFPLGVLIGSLAILFLLWAIEGSNSSLIEEIAIKVYLGFVSLFAASLALYGVLTSIDNQNAITATANSRSLAAAKSVLPLSLSQMIEVAKRGSEISLDIGTSNLTIDELILQIQLPPQIIPVVKEAIQHSSPQNGERIANLIRTHQVVAARTERWLTENYRPLLQNYTNSINWAILCRLIEDCLEYSRAETSEIPKNLTNPNLRGFFAVKLHLSSVDLDQIMPEILSIENQGKFEMF